MFISLLKSILDDYTGNHIKIPAHTIYPEQPKPSHICVFIVFNQSINYTFYIAMVKNTHGGNKSKGMARKNVVDHTDKRKLRLSSCDLEKYAVVTKMLGNGMFYTTTNEGDELLGRIRNKFKGRSRRGNNLGIGTMVLVGLREWEAPHYKECDLLEVYDANEIKQIRQMSSIDTHLLNKMLDANISSTATTADESECGIEFSTEGDTDYLSNLLPEKETAGEIRSAEDEINIDDI